MKSRIVKIGNSRGVRIPKPLLEKSGLGEEVEMEAREGEIVIRAARPVRQEWTEAFRSMAGHRDDVLLDSEAGRSVEWDEEEWEWCRADSTCSR